MLTLGQKKTVSKKILEKAKKDIEGPSHRLFSSQKQEPVLDSIPISFAVPEDLANRKAFASEKKYAGLYRRNVVLLL